MAKPHLEVVNAGSDRRWMCKGDFGPHSALCYGITLKHAWNNWVALIQYMRMADGYLPALLPPIL